MIWNPWRRIAELEAIAQARIELEAMTQRRIAAQQQHIVALQQHVDLLHQAEERRRALAAARAKVGGAAQALATEFGRRIEAVCADDPELGEEEARVAAYREHPEFIVAHSLLKGASDPTSIEAQALLLMREIFAPPDPRDLVNNLLSFKREG